MDFFFDREVWFFFLRLMFLTKLFFCFVRGVFLVIAISREGELVGYNSDVNGKPCGNQKTAIFTIDLYGS